ncbi:MAG: transcription antitermination factor NusB [Deltaproteobacteria bacterium]|nr:transcription antitermination factor NusB [Deltaproteobacteria bacterium]
MGNRHKSREFALQILYASDVSDTPLRQVLPYFWETLTCPAEVRRFADEIALGVEHHRDEIDGAIARFAEHWTIDRMTSVDRNILRMAVFELFYLPDVPESVTINEAVEIGKKFGAEESGAFVNGILDRIAKEKDATRIEYDERDA